MVVKFKLSETSDTMAAYSTTMAKNAFPEIINRAADGKERVVLTRRGKKVVAVIPYEDLERLQRIEAEEEAEDIREARKALSRYKKTGKARLFSEVKKELGL
jgi:prevent-host-death family protein